MSDINENDNINNEEVDGIPNAPALRSTSEHTGFCRFCNQLVVFEAPDGLSDMDYNELATANCDCAEAKAEKKKREKLEAAGAWAREAFSQSKGSLQLVLCAIRSTYEGEAENVTIKIGKYRHKIDKDNDGMIRIKSVYSTSNEEKF